MSAMWGGRQVLDARGANKYASFPWAALDSALNTHITYRNYDGVNPCDHSTGGAAWYIRNFGATAKKFDAVSEGRQVQAFNCFQLPGTTQLVFNLRLFLAGVADLNRVAVSPDLGVTIPATIALPNIDGIDNAGVEFCNYMYAPDGRTVFCFAYANNTALTKSDVVLLYTVDGTHWFVRSFLRRSTDAVPRFNEVGAWMFPDGRILAVLRNDVALANAATMYSDDYGLTWSAPLIYANTNDGDNFQLASPAKGYAINNQYAVVTGRLNASGGVSTDPVATAAWILDRNGVYVNGPEIIQRGANASHNGYTALLDVPNKGRMLIAYSDEGINDGLGYQPALIMAPFGVRSVA